MLSADVAVARGDFSLTAELRVGVDECVAIAGPSGAGKSTLLRLLAGLARADRGTIEMGGQVWLDTESGRSLAPEKRRVGFVFQDYALFPRMPAWKNVAYGIEGSRGERRRLARESLDRLGMSARADARPADLSGGERQRVALARALASDPRLLLLDEPLSALDARTRASSSRELARVLAEAEVPALIVTHDFGEAALLADRVVVMDGGRIVQEGRAADLAAKPASGLVADLTGAVVLRGTATAAPGGLTAVALEGGGTVISTDDARGPVAASVFPWEIEIGPVAEQAEGSALNRLEGEVVSVTEFGNRARVGLNVPQPLAAEVTSASIARMALRPGSSVAVGWKATATRLTPL